MVRFIDDHRAGLGVEPICAVLPIAPSTYHRHRQQRTDPTGRSARAQRDDQLRVEIQRVYDEHQQVYGPRKVWEAAAAGRRLRGALYRGAPDARDGPRRGRPGPDLDHHDPRRCGRPPRGPRRPLIRGHPSESALGLRLHVCRDWGRLRLRRVRHRRVCTTHCGLAGGGLHAHGLRARRVGAGDLRSPGRRSDRPRASQ